MKKIIGTIVLFSFFLQIVFPGYLWSALTEKDKITIAIMDFLNTSGKKDYDYLQKAIPEALITRLAKSGKLTIVERSRLEDALKEMNLSFAGIVDQSKAVEIGRAVGANAILVGSFLEIGGLIRINARLIDVETSKVLKAEVVQGNVGRQIFQLMDDLAAGIERELVGEPAPPGKQLKKATPTKMPKKPLTRRPARPVRAVKKSGGGNTMLFILGGAALIGGGIVALALLNKKDTGPTTVSVEIVVPLND